MQITVLTEADLRDCVALNAEAITAVEGGFTALGRGEANTPPIMRLDFPELHGEVDVKTATVKGLDSFAIKVASGFFDNPKLGLPSGSGLMLVWSATNGFLEAIQLDNGYLTHLRTGAAGAIAAKYLARQKIETVGVVGTGDQGAQQLVGLKQVRDFNRVMAYDLVLERLSSRALA